MDWDHLRIVLAVRQKGSMHAAAQALGIDRATVLRRLGAIEAQLGASLFDRRRDGCTLTPAGLDMIETLEGVAETLAALESSVGGADSRAEGTVCLALPEFFAVKVLAPALPRFHAAYPNITLKVRTGHELLNLARGEADIAWRNRRPEQNSLVSRRVGTGAIGLFASPRYIAAHGMPAQGDFDGHRLLLFDDSLAGVPGCQWIEQRIGRARVVMRCNEIAPLLAAAREGVGIALLPAIAAFGEAELEPLPPGILATMEAILVTHRDLRRRARVRAVFDFVVRLCTENAAAIAGVAIADKFGDHAGVRRAPPSSP
ncbi:MAG: LysR family transcriptional regulator [Devosia sp.]|nr:LysR family transcriptional regulator [Devosia sp.]